MSTEPRRPTSDRGAATARHMDYDRNVSAQNRRGEYVPAIPLPFFGLRHRCSCGQKFWTLRGYQGHYALEHILGFWA